MLRDLLICSVSDQPETLIECDAKELEQKVLLSRQLPTACIMRMMRTLQEGIYELGRTTEKNLLAEMTLISLCREELGEDYASLSARIARLEKGGVIAAAPAIEAPIKPQPKAEAPAPQASAAPAVKETPPAPAAEESACPFWEMMKEILQDTGHANLLGFLLDITPAVQGDRLLLRSEQDFCINFLDMPEHKAALSAAAARAGGREYRIILEKTAAGLAEDDPLQELIKENNL